MEWNQGHDTSNREKPKQFQSSGFKPKGNFIKKKVLLKGGQPKGDASGKPKGMCFNYNEVGALLQKLPQTQTVEWGFSSNCLVANLA